MKVKYFTSAVLLSCLISKAIYAQDVAGSPSALLGSTAYANDCTAEWQNFNEKIMMFGRIAAASDAFEEAVRSNVLNLYRKCNGDPFYDENVETQIQKVMEVCRSVNNVHIKCTGARANASAGIGYYDLPTDEAFSWGGWFSSVYDQSLRVYNPADRTIRHAPYPWPFTQGAGLVWHEVMHQHGYTHGADSQNEAIINCGQTANPAWDFQVNTMPYIIGNSINEILDQSAALADINDCPYKNQLKIITHYNGAECKCINDPGKKGLGIVGIKNNQLIDKAILPNDYWIGGWHFDLDNGIAGKGDFNGDGKEDFIITSGWGIGIITFDGNIWRDLMVKPNGTHFGAWIFSSTQSVFKGIGDFNGDHKDDILITSDWGIGLLTLTGNTLTSLVAKPNGTRFGAWNFSSTQDLISLIGDFNGDRKDDLLIKSDWGIGLLTLSGSTFNSLIAEPNGTRFGDWNYSSSENRIRGIGDFNGDHKDDILLTSGWGIGLLTLNGSSLNSLVVKPNGTFFGDWNYSTPHNVIIGIGDFNGDHKGDIVLTGSWGIGILTLSGATFNSLVAKPYGTWFGSWNFSTADNINGIADFNGDNKDDILVKSGWGIGLLTLDRTSFNAIAIHPYKDLLGSWILQNEDDIKAIGKYGDAYNNILFKVRR